VKRAIWVIVAAVGVCAAFPRDASSSTIPAFDSLPQGHVGRIPQKKPPFIAAGERTAGIVAAAPPKDALGQGPAWVTVFATEEKARQFRKTGAAEEPGTEVCFTTEDRVQVFPRDNGLPVEWPSFFEAQPTMQGRQFSYGSMSGGVEAVHAEKLVRGAPGKATLEMTDAWVDPDTRGVRLIRSATLPLVRVATGPSGIEVYAGRDDEEAQFVVTAPKLPDGFPRESANFARQFTRMNASLDENRFATSDCDHVRIALRAAEEKGPVLSVVQTTAFLPSLDKGDDEGARDKKGFGGIQGFRAIQSVRKRAVNISLSATQTDGDKEPVLSVAVGWGGREARQ